MQKSIDKNKILDDNFSELLKKNENFEQFDAVFVDSFDKYQQKNYEKILKAQNEKDIKLWAWKNDKANAEFAIICGEQDLENVTISVSDLKAESNIIGSKNVKVSFIRDVKAYTGHAGWYANNPANITRSYIF